MSLVENTIRKLAGPQAQDDFGPNNWYYRRLVIMVSLSISGLIIVAVALVVVAAIAMTAWTGRSPSYDVNLLRLAESLIWPLLTFAGSIIGAYVFAANWDAKDYRKNITEMQSRGIVTTVESKVVTTPVQSATPTPLPDQGNQPDEEPIPTYASEPTNTTATSKATQEPAG